jgi:hypothetical protein
VAVGHQVLGNLTTGNANVAIGSVNGGSGSGSALTSGSNNVLIANAGAVESSTMRFGTPGNQTRTFIAGIRGVTTGASNAVNVLIDSNGQLGTVNSSRRFKFDILDMGEASSKLMQLRPVTFRYRQAQADGSHPVQYGLIAEEVEELYPDLVAHSADGQIETVQYWKLDAMLLNEVQKQAAIIRQQSSDIDELRSRLEALERLLPTSPR